MRIRVNGNRAQLEPLDGFVVGAAGEDAVAALHNASRLLDHVFEKPEVQALMPPGTVAAVRLLRGATAAIRKGELPKFLEAVPSRARRLVTRTLRKVLPW